MQEYCDKEEEELYLNYEKLKEDTKEKKFIANQNFKAKLNADMMLKKRKSQTKPDTMIIEMDSTLKNIFPKISLLSQKSEKKATILISPRPNFFKTQMSKNMLESEISSIPCSKLETELFWGTFSDFKLLKLPDEMLEKSNKFENEEDIFDKIRNLNMYKKCNCIDIIILDEDELSNYAFKLFLEYYKLKIMTTCDIKIVIKVLFENCKDKNCCLGLRAIFVRINKSLKKCQSFYQEMFEIIEKKRSKMGFIAIIENITQKKVEKIKKNGFSEFVTRPIFKSLIFLSLKKYWNLEQEIEMIAI